MVKAFIKGGKDLRWESEVSGPFSRAKAKTHAKAICSFIHSNMFKAYPINFSGV